ncbi:hypothetical protein [Nocardioides yefusunii]|uniref:Uncharacterized protein n=1 Tax=Nocardioides yefusunii TaxID=2500546 RepID=A0ABW1QW77_9ACTN|nr:hypothetical protein [Nocardioides yefusunii]
MNQESSSSSTVADLEATADRDDDSRNGRGLRLWRTVALGFFAAVTVLACALSLWPEAEPVAPLAAGEVQLAHEAFVRAGTESELRVEVPGDADTDGWVQVFLPRDLVDVIGPTAVRPRPVAEHASADGWALTFPAGTAATVSGRVPVDRNAGRVRETVSAWVWSRIPDALPERAPDASLETTVWVLP